jgi:hypothetical protein
MILQILYLYVTLNRFTHIFLYVIFYMYFSLNVKKNFQLFFKEFLKSIFFLYQIRKKYIEIEV